ncbi:MAG: tetratricopeptide repeat protein [Bacteroidales bacterium]|nr:tetratricopeptide repeat protein [Bacteroidales bacterium]MBN2818590.1 tetratricopeptide repeat protein [Bacteroidales bacterium]
MQRISLQTKFFSDFSGKIFLNRIPIVFSAIFFLFLFEPGQSQESTALSELEIQLSNTENDTIKAELLMQIAIKQYYLNTQEAIRYANMALDAFTEINNEWGIGRCNNILGAAFFNLGEFDKAEKFYLKSNLTSNSIHDTLYIAKSYNNLGNVYQKLGKLNNSVNSYLNALTVYRESENTVGAIGVINNIASLYYTTGSYYKAIEYYRQAASEAKKINDYTTLSSVYFNMSAVYSELEDYKNALNFCELSYNLRQKTDYNSGIIHNLISFGTIYECLENFSKSRTYFNDALTIARDDGYTDEESTILLHLGYLDLVEENYAEAGRSFKDGLSIAINNESMELVSEFHKYLYTIDSLTGNFESAFSNLQAYNKTKKEFSSYDLDKRMADLESKYNLSKQENIEQDRNLQKTRFLITCLFGLIAILVFISIIIIQQINLKSRKRIAELSQENLRSQINPHFIFNVLNSIHAYILQNDKESSSNYLLKFARLLRLTLNNSQANLTTINDELEALKIYLELESMRLNHKLDYEIHLDDEIDPFMFKIPPLIIQPYVENSIIHGLQNKNGDGKILIDLRYKDRQIHCMISDNGVGRSQAAILKSKHQKESGSLGTKITETRLDLLNSFYGKKMKMVYSDLLDNENKPTGTKVEFNLPILT